MGWGMEKGFVAAINTGEFDTSTMPKGFSEEAWGSNGCIFTSKSLR